MDQKNWGVTANLVVCGVDRVSQSIGIFIPISLLSSDTYILIALVNVCTLRSAVPFACGLYISHSRSLLLGDDTVKRMEEIRHES